MTFRRVALVTLVAAAASCRTTPSFTAQDEKEVRSLADVTVEAFRIAKYEPWLDLWTDDAVLQPPNNHPMVGRAAREAWAKGFPPVEQIDFPTVTVSGDGNVAYGTTTYILKTKGTPVDSGKQLFVARRQADGKWKVVAGSLRRRSMRT